MDYRSEDNPILWYDGAFVLRNRKKIVNALTGRTKQYLARICEIAKDDYSRLAYKNNF